MKVRIGPVLTVTLAPAVDWTVSVEGFELGGVNRAVSSTREASGKGVNVAWALNRAGVPVDVLVPGAGTASAFIDDELERAGIPHRTVPTRRETRTNITLRVPGSSTKINEPAPALSEDELAEVTREIRDRAASAEVLALCGSLPASVPASTYAGLIEAARAANPDLRVVLDTSGEPLALALAARPDLVKPNVDELAELTGRTIETLGDVRSAAEQAMELGAGAVLASLGADGSLLVTAEGVFRAVSRDIPVSNSVGAGDALLAGFIAGGDFGPRSLETAALWAASAVSAATTLFPVREEFAERIAVAGDPDPAAALTEPSRPLSKTPGPLTAG